MAQKLEGIIEITPNCKCLSSQELTTLRQVDREPLHTGLKRTLNTGAPEEQQELQKLFDDLRRQLSVSRIERLDGRALAVWNTEDRTVEVLRKDGKFGNFGYSHNGKHYLDYFEAMFLLELGRLQLEYHGMIMSIEQAYLLLLGEQASHKYDEYLVYSMLSRVGYIVVKHRNVRFVERHETTQMDCVWEVLFSALQKTPVPEYIKKCVFYAKTKEQMEVIKANIIAQQQDNAETPDQGEAPGIDFNKRLQSTGKRKSDETGYNDARETKRLCATESIVANHSLVNLLKDEPEYKQFQHIFQKFDIIKLKPTTACEEECERQLHINFDLYLHNEGFKKSTPTPPVFRVVILDAETPFPTHSEISQCHRQQLHAVPLLIVCVSESKQIQAFLYYFT